MSNPVRMALLVPLCVCCSLLIHSPSSLAETLGPPELHMPGAKFGGMYRRVLRNNPATLDPAFLTDIYGRAVVRQIFDGLVQFDAHLNPLPALAEFWEASRDRRTWTFTLRRGVTFHHGREVTAHDVVYSFTRLLRVHKAHRLWPISSGVSKGPRSSCGGKLTYPGAESGGSLYPADGAGRATWPLPWQSWGWPMPQWSLRKRWRRLGERFGRAPVGTGPVQICAVGAEPGDRAGGQRPLL